MNLTRRNWLKTAAGLLVAAPFVAKAETLMRIARPTRIAPAGIPDITRQALAIVALQGACIREIEGYDISGDQFVRRIDVIGEAVHRHVSYRLNAYDSADERHQHRQGALQALADSFGATIADIERLPDLLRPVPGLNRIVRR